MSADRTRKILRIVTRMNIGGPARHVAILSGALNQDGWRTVVAAGAPSAHEGDFSGLLDRSVAQVRLPGLQREIRPLGDLAAWWRLVRLVRREQPDVLHTHMAKAGMLGRLAGLWVNALGRPRGRRKIVLIHTFHGHVLSGYFGRAHTWLFTRLERWLAARTDLLIAISPSVRDDLLRLGIGEPSKIRVIPLGLNLDGFFAVEDATQAFRQELGVAPGAPLIGIIGRLVPIKQHELFLEAAGLLLRRRPDARFVIIGDGERRAELEALARQRGLEGAVRFTGWRADLAAIYADLDCVCLTSRNEGTPVSAIEAMAAGRPVVATAVGGVPDLLGPIVDHGQDCDVAERGVLVQLHAGAQGVAAAVERVLADAPLRQRLAVAGRMHAAGSLTGDRLVRDTAQLYHALLDAGATAASAEAATSTTDMPAIPEPTYRGDSRA